MPTFSYTLSDFLPFTKIRASDFNSKFSDIATFLNGQIGNSNIADNSINRNTKLLAGTANYVVINDSNGKMSEEATLATTRGGLGFAPTINSANALKSVIVNAAGTGLELGAPAIDNLILAPAGDVTGITAGEAISANDAVCMELHNGTGSNVYRIFKCDSDLSNRKTSFIGFATAAASVTPNIKTWTNSANFVASNVCTWSINGRSYTQSFSVDNDTTLAAIAAQIAGDPDVQSAAVTDSGSNDRIITITSKGALSLNITTPVTTGGVSQPTTTIAQTQAASGGAVQVCSIGPLSGFTSLTPGAIYYVSSTAGGITSSPTDSNPQQVGQAWSDTVLFVNSDPDMFRFGISSLFIRAFGGSTGETLSNGSTTIEQFNFSSWSSGTADSTAKNALHSGESTLSGFLVCVDGINTAGSNVTDTRLYNKSAWSAGATRTTDRMGGAVSGISGKLVFWNGSENTTFNGAVGNVDEWNGTAWNNGATTTTSGLIYRSGHTGSSKAYAAGGITSAGGGNNAHESWNGSSKTNETNFPASIGGCAGSSATGGQGITGVAGGSPASYKWSGSAWSSDIAPGYTLAGDVNRNIGPSSGYNSNNSKAYMNGGSSGATTSISTTKNFDGSSWNTDTASTSSRAGAQAGVF